MRGSTAARSGVLHVFEGGIANRRPWLLVGAIAALSILLGAIQLGATTLWNDETFSILTSQDGLWRTIRYIVNDNQPPLYYVVLSQWLHLGDSIFWIRLYQSPRPRSPQS